MVVPEHPRTIVDPWPEGALKIRAEPGHLILRLMRARR